MPDLFFSTTQTALWSHSRRRATRHRRMGSNAPSARSTDAVCGCLLWLSASGAREYSRALVAVSTPLPRRAAPQAHEPMDCTQGTLTSQRTTPQPEDYTHTSRTSRGTTAQLIRVWCGVAWRCGSAARRGATHTHTHTSPGTTPQLMRVWPENRIGASRRAGKPENRTLTPGCPRSSRQSRRPDLFAPTPLPPVAPD